MAVIFTTMIKIIYPDKQPSVKREAGKECVFCFIRRKWLVLTPEEWVRQNFLLYLTETLGYDRSIIAVEKKLMLGEVEKRFDIVVYDSDTRPFIIIECKEMNVPLSAMTFNQVLRYNITLGAAYLVITNGSYCHAFTTVNNTIAEVDALPVKK